MTYCNFHNNNSEMVAFADNFQSQDAGKAALLLVEDEQPVMDVLVRILSRDYEVYAAPDCEHAQQILDEEDIEVIICDHGLPGENGLDFLSRVRQDYPYIQRILLTGQRDLDLAIRAINEGDVHRYLPKPADFSTVCEAINSGLEKRKEMLHQQKLSAENAVMKEKMRKVPSLCRQLRALSRDAGRFTMKAMSIYLIGSLGFFICGLGLLLVLYLIKTVAGVDFLEVGLDDVVTQFHNWAVSLVNKA